MITRPSAPNRCGNTKVDAAMAVSEKAKIAAPTPVSRCTPGRQGRHHTQGHPVGDQRRCQRAGVRSNPRQRGGNRDDIPGQAAWPVDDAVGMAGPKRRDVAELGDEEEDALDLDVRLDEVAHPVAQPGEEQGHQDEPDHPGPPVPPGQEEARQRGHRQDQADEAGNLCVREFGDHHLDRDDEVRDQPVARWAPIRDGNSPCARIRAAIHIAGVSDCARTPWIGWTGSCARTLPLGDQRAERVPGCPRGVVSRFHLRQADGGSPTARHLRCAGGT